MTRFFTQPENIGDGIISLSSDDTAHIRSLRMRPGELFIVCDGKSNDYLCRLQERHPTDGEYDGRSIAQIIKRQKSNTEPSVKCTAFLALAKGDRLEYAVQKSVELGAHKIVLYESERSIVRMSDALKKMDRFQKIALETAKQSGRGIIPEVSALDDLNSVIATAVKHSDRAMLCYEDEKSLHIMTALEHFFPKFNLIKKPLDKIKTIAVITGPEGGFEPSEVMVAQSMDISVVTLGPRILRCETAPVVALSAIMYHTGNL